MLVVTMQPARSHRGCSAKCGQVNVTCISSTQGSLIGLDGTHVIYAAWLLPWLVQEYLGDAFIGESTQKLIRVGRGEGTRDI